MTAERDEYEIDTRHERLDLALVHQWLSTDTAWAADRTREVVDRAAAASLNLGAYVPGEGQVGYARVVTDRATFGWLCDVYVAPAHRGRGLGIALARAAVDELAPYGLARLLLSTIDAHDVHAKVGFAPFPNPEKLMILDR